MLWRHARPSYSGKVWPDDEVPLWDVWVFADLWRRLGITYPDAQGLMAAEPIPRGGPTQG